MRKILSFIPNTLTMGNLCCSSLAIYFAFQTDFTAAFWAIIVAAVFDFFDGFAARMLKAYSPIGAGLDSLSDMVSFGVAPTMIAFNLLLTIYPEATFYPWFAGISFIFAICAALRLAKFNIDPNQSDKFIGLPSPAAAILVASLAITPFVANGWFVFVVIIAALAMVVNMEMFALKFKNFSPKNNIEKYVFLLLAVILLVIFGVYTGSAAVILLYMVMSGVLAAVKKR